MAVGLWDRLYILQPAPTPTPTPTPGEGPTTQPPTPNPQPQGRGQPPNPRGGANHPTPRAQFHANERKEGRDANPQPQERNPTPTSARRGETPIPNPKSAIPPQRVWNQPTQTHAQEPRPIHTFPHPAHHDNFTRPPPGLDRPPTRQTPQKRLNRSPPNPMTPATIQATPRNQKPEDRSFIAATATN